MIFFLLIFYLLVLIKNKDGLIMVDITVDINVVHMLMFSKYIKWFIASVLQFMIRIKQILYCCFFFFAQILGEGSDDFVIATTSRDEIKNDETWGNLFFLFL